MSIFLKSQWQDWAREWGLAHSPEKGWMYRCEHVIGQRHGLLIRVGWGPHESPGLVTCIRFPRVTDLQRLRQALVDDTSLDTLPGKGAGRRKMLVQGGAGRTIHLGGVPEFTLGENSLIWRRKFAFRTPKPAQVRAWVDALVAAVARATPVFAGRCESCETGSATRYVLVDDLPMMLCTSCQQRLEAEGELAERSYDMTEARHLPGTMLSVFAALVGALAWAAIGVLTQRIFAIAAIGVGALVAWVYRVGAGRVDAVGRAIAACLTVCSVVMGEVVLYTWWVAKADPRTGFQLEAGWLAYQTAWQKAPGQEIVTLFFALIGAWFATRVLVRPKLKAKIEDGEQRRAA